MQLNRSLALLEMVETWMVNGTDHWFIKPSVWNGIPVGRRSRILEDILHDAYNIGHPYPRSIFDSLREEMLKLPDGETEPATDRAREMKKLG